MMSKTTGNPITVLCQTDGKIIASCSAVYSPAGSLGFNGGESVTVAQLGLKLGSEELRSKFETFAASEKVREVFPLSCRSGEFRINLQKLNDPQSERLVLIIFDDQGESPEQRFLVEVGRVAERLIHDFKNQIQPLMIYAALLKKRFGDQPEELDITEKIIRGLNTMRDHAVLVTKLTRRIELNRELTDPGELIKRAVNDHRMLAEARSIKIQDEVEDHIPAVHVDAKQLRTALGAIMTRAIEISPEGGVVRISLQSDTGGLRIEVGDQGEILSEQQRETLFDFLTNERINNASLNMALARRIIEQHGGQISVKVASMTGTVVQMNLPI